MLQNPVQLQAILLELTQGLAFDPAAAALLLHNTSTGGAHLPRALPSTEQESVAAPQAAEAPGCCDPAEKSRPENMLFLSAAVTGAVGQPGSTQEPLLDASLPAQHALSGGLQLPAVVLPRMPGGLKFIATDKAYEAAVRIARVLGHAAAGSGGPADKGVAQLFCPGLQDFAWGRRKTCSSTTLLLLAQGDLSAPRLLCGVASCAGILTWQLQVYLAGSALCLREKGSPPGVTTSSHSKHAGHHDCTSMVPTSSVHDVDSLVLHHMQVHKSMLSSADSWRCCSPPCPWM